MKKEEKGNFVENYVKPLNTKKIMLTPEERDLVEEYANKYLKGCETVKGEPEFPNNFDEAMDSIIKQCQKTLRTRVDSSIHDDEIDKIVRGIFEDWETWQNKNRILI